MPAEQEVIALRIESISGQIGLEIWEPPPLLPLMLTIPFHLKATAFK